MRRNSFTDRSEVNIPLWPGRSSSSASRRAASGGSGSGGPPRGVAGSGAVVEPGSIASVTCDRRSRAIADHEGLEREPGRLGRLGLVAQGAEEQAQPLVDGYARRADADAAAAPPDGAREPAVLDGGVEVVVAEPDGEAADLLAPAQPACPFHREPRAEGARQPGHEGTEEHAHVAVVGTQGRCQQVDVKPWACVSDI